MYAWHGSDYNYLLMSLITSTIGMSCLGAQAGQYANKMPPEIYNIPMIPIWVATSREGAQELVDVSRYSNVLLFDANMGSLVWLGSGKLFDTNYQWMQRWYRQINAIEWVNRK